MLKKIFCSTTLLAVLVLLFSGLAAAQTLPPTMTIHEQGLARPSGTQVHMPAGYIPAYCNPCLFYGGDGDPNSPNADGLWDNNSSYFGIDSEVFSPFVVPRKTGKCGGACAWNVSKLNANIEFYPYPPVMDDATWYIVGPNTFPGTVVCHGTDSAPTLTDTGRLFFTYLEEFNVAVHVSGCPSLVGGKNGTEYWENVTPETSVFELAYESNVPDTPPPNAYGPPEPRDQAYSCSPYPSCSGQLGFPFDIFSASVEGVLGKK